MTITEALKRFRKEYRLSQKQVAEELGLTQQMYQYYESRGDLPTAGVVALADKYKLSTDYLLGRIDNPAASATSTANNDKVAELAVSFASALREQIIQELQENKN